MDFTKLNKERKFDIDTSSFDYVNLEDLYTKNGPDKQYRVRGVYISNKSKFVAEAPMVALDDTYVNLPDHQIEAIKAILENKSAIKQVNDGELGFVISHYYQKRFKKDCYSAVFINMEPDVDDDDDEA